MPTVAGARGPVVTRLQGASYSAYWRRVFGVYTIPVGLPNNHRTEGSSISIEARSEVETSEISPQNKGMLPVS